MWGEFRASECFLKLAPTEAVAEDTRDDGGFGLPHVGFVEVELAVEVRVLDHVQVDNFQATEPGSAQEFRHFTSQTARTDHEKVFGLENNRGELLRKVVAQHFIDWRRAGINKEFSPKLERLSKDGV